MHKSMTAKIVKQWESEWVYTLCLKGKKVEQSCEEEMAGNINLENEGGKKRTETEKKQLRGLHTVREC